MKRRLRGIKRIHRKCPECKEIQRFVIRPNVKYFQAKRYNCRNCDFGGTLGQFEKVEYDDW